MKRVMIMLPQLWTGGISMMNIELAAHTHDPRLELVILSLYPNSGSVIDCLATERGVKVIYLDKKPGVDLSIIGKIYRTIKEVQPDVLHINQRMTTYALIPMILGKIKKRIYVVHSMADRDAKGIVRAVNRFAFHHLHLIPVAISESCKNSISSVYDIPDDRITIINNGVDLTRFRRIEPYVNTSNCCTFISVSAFREEKNLLLLLEAFAQVHRDIANTRLILVGDGEMMSLLKQMVVEYDLEDSVELPGFAENVPDWLNRAQVFVLSSNIEGLPISILEAMSMALPIVATKVGGVVDIVEDGVNGILVEPRDREQLTNAMLILAQDFELRKKFSVASEIKSKEFSIERCVDKYVELYTGDVHE